jgi:hypothetical protein
VEAPGESHLGVELVDIRQKCGGRLDIIDGHGKDLHVGMRLADQPDVIQRTAIANRIVSVIVCQDAVTVGDLLEQPLNIGFSHVSSHCPPPLGPTPDVKPSASASK